MDIILNSLKSDQHNLLLASGIGSTIGAVVGLFANDENNILESYIDMTKGIVYGGIAGPLVLINPYISVFVSLSTLSYILCGETLKYTHKQTNKKTIKKPNKINDTSNINKNIKPINLTFYDQM